MLVLKRKLGEKIYIDGGLIEIELVEAGRDWCKLGITAPASVSVLRDDLIPEGPPRCCHCGGQLPPPGPDGVRPTARPGCGGECDEVSGRCSAFLASTLWGNLPIGPEREDGAA
jgi:carbon storage regulator CsrA